MTLKEMLRKVRNWIWNQKYRVQLGMQWLVIVNFSLLLITVSKALGLRAGAVLAIAVPLGFIGMWLFGYVLDKIVRGGESDEATQIHRLPILRNHYSQQQEILDAVREIREAVKGESKGHDTDLYPQERSTLGRGDRFRSRPNL